MVTVSSYGATVTFYKWLKLLLLESGNITEALVLRALNSRLALKSHEFERCCRKTKLETTESESWSEEFGVYREKLLATIYLAYFLLCGRWIWAIWIRCYLFELESTDEEIQHREEQTREWGGQQAEEGELAAAKMQRSGNWWCSCGCCDRLPTQGRESLSRFWLTSHSKLQSQHSCRWLGGEKAGLFKTQWRHSNVPKAETLWDGRRNGHTSNCVSVKR